MSCLSVNVGGGYGLCRGVSFMDAAKDTSFAKLLKD